MRPRVLSAALFLVLMIPVAAAAQLLPASSGPLRPGDIVVVTNLQPPGSETSPGVLLKIDPSTGIRTTLSDFADPSQGPIGRPSSGSSAVVVEDSTAVFVAHSLFGTNGRGALLNVDPSTGLRRILSDFGDVSQGPPAGAGQLAIEPSGDFLLFNGPALIRVSGITGIREMVSDFQNPAQGPIVGSAITFGSRITVGESGQIVISGVGSNGEHALFSVDRTNGVRSLLSDFGDPTQGLSGAVFDLTVDFSGDFLVTVHIDAPRIMDQYQLVRVDPKTGTRARVSTACGASMPTFPMKLAVEETGDLLELYGELNFFYALCRVDANTGASKALGFLLGYPDDYAVVLAPLVNGMVSLSVASAVFEPSTSDPSAPAGMFRITATLTNITTSPILNPFFRVAELTGGNVLLSADRPPDLIRGGGKGTRQTAALGSDNVISPGESVGVEFAIGLKTRQPFTFFVNVFGEPDAEEGSR